MIYRSLVALGAAFLATSAHAITVDGSYDAAYGNATAFAIYSPTASGGFQTPTNQSPIAYAIYLAAAQGKVFGYLRADPSSGGSVVLPTFSNVYFDIDPNRAVPNGSDVGFELGANSQTVFLPGMSGPIAASGITVAVSADNLGIEFSIPNSFFTMPVAGLAYDGEEEFPVVGGAVTLRLSQSFGYPVVGGASYGVDRLGRVTLAAVPEPASWALMIGGFGLVGAAARRRRAAVAA